MAGKKKKEEEKGGGTCILVLKTSATQTLGLLVPQAQLFLGNVVGEMVALAAALDAALVGGAFARCIAAAAVLQQTRVPLQTQAVRTEARLPQVFSGMTGLEAGQLRCLGQDLKYGAIHSCNTNRRPLKQKARHRKFVRI